MSEQMSWYLPPQLNASHISLSFLFLVFMRAIIQNLWLIACEKYGGIFFYLNYTFGLYLGLIPWKYPKDWNICFSVQAHCCAFIRTCFLINSTATFEEEYFSFCFRSLSLLIVIHSSIDLILELLFELLIVDHS